MPFQRFGGTGETHYFIMTVDLSVLQKHEVVTNEAEGKGEAAKPATSECP